MGADIVIAVDIYCHSNATAGLSAGAVVRQTMHIQSCLIAAVELADADMVISPVVAVPGISDKEQQQRVIQAGYEAARKVLASSDLAALRTAAGAGECGGVAAGAVATASRRSAART